MPADRMSADRMPSDAEAEVLVAVADGRDPRPATPFGPDAWDAVQTVGWVEYEYGSLRRLTPSGRAALARYRGKGSAHA